MRGNPRQIPQVGRHTRSIPARAGEPCAHRRSLRTLTVYPRACGGTCVGGMVFALKAGLSPRVRGNRGFKSRQPDQQGSIPARAGEPGAERPDGSADRVYPRACGGTPNSFMDPIGGEGLSPRVRGNPYVARVGSIPRGSIPARAGEPGSGRNVGDCGRVYPRACGGTGRHSRQVTSIMGLSPRVRGNPTLLDFHGIPPRSIPARAGEPRFAEGRARPRKVYPRACGGTGATVWGATVWGGLSPRVRGNRDDVVLRD